MSDRSAKRQKTEEITGPPVLPAEMFELVIGQMNVNEWIACRAVCKFFKQVVDKIKLRNLAIAEDEDSACKSVFDYRKEEDYDFADHVDYKRFSDRFYFVSNDPVYESDTLISPNTTAGLRMLVNHFDLSQLRRLFVVEVRNGRAHFDLLNRLVQLEDLQINWIQMDADLKLQLPNLQTLSIVQLIGDEDFQVLLDTPNLKHFETRVLEEFRFAFEHPDSVIFLQVSRCAHDDVLVLRNLEMLVCEWASSLVWIDREKCSLDDDRAELLDFSRLPQLQRVDCARMDNEEAEELCYCLRSNQIDFYYCGMKIDNLYDDLRAVMEATESDEMLKLLDQESFYEFYDLLADSLYFCESIKYRSLEDFTLEGIPENFANKFYLVREIFVPGRIKSVDHMVKLFSYFKCLKFLRFENPGLPEKFFDRHSHLFARLHELTYDIDPYPERDKVNLKFILNLRYLEKFRTNKPISMRLASEAFSTLKYLKTFSAQDFKIIRDENKFEVISLGKASFRDQKFDSLPEMLKFMEERHPNLFTDSN